MSYIAYLNGFQLDLSDVKPIAYTRQINDLARLDTRQSNFTHKITLPFTQQNIEAVKNVGQLGNQSNIPYQKNRFDLIDAESGKHLIYNGWAVIGATTLKGYEINVYDGIIDFYRTIENKNLTDCGISDLNHLKNLTNIVASWDDSLPYKYIIADYNGKVLTSDNKLNADYLVPSAKISYLWERVHQFAGYTYTGSIFNTEKFINFYMTFPKPVPTEEPIVTAITNQTSEIAVENPNSLFPFLIDVFPNNFTTTEANNIGSLAGVVNITQTGSYLFNSYGTLIQSGVGTITELDYVSINAIGEIIEQGTFNPTIELGIIVNCEAGGKLMIGRTQFFGGFANAFTGSLETSLALIVGYDANFEEALIDFSIKDFVNEIMQHFGLTAFKDKYENKIKYLTLDEILQNPDTLDWSDKFSGRNTEKYIFGNYGKKNTYSYRYNNDNEKHNDGFLTIDNENLKDEVAVLKSKIYAPNSEKTTVLGLYSNVYPIWSRTPKDNGDVEFKELEGRFYYMRYQTHDYGSTHHLKSEVLNTSVTFTTAPIESYYRLKLSQVLYDNYSTIESIFNKSKVIEAEFYLSVSDVESFEFDKLVFIKQLGSYYLVNKIVNFIPNRLTKAELVEVDYFVELPVPEPTEYYIAITDAVPDDCEITFTVDTNIEQPTTVSIVAYALTPDGLGGTYYAPYVTVYGVTMNSNTVTHLFTELPPMVYGGYKFKIVHTSDVFLTTESNITDVVAVSTDCYSPATADLTYITITSVETISVSAGERTVEVDYVSDLSVATMTITLVANGSLIPITQDYLLSSQNGTLTIELPHALYGDLYQYSIYLIALGVTSNTAYSNE